MGAEKNASDMQKNEEELGAREAESSVEDWKQAHLSHAWECIF